MTEYTVSLSAALSALGVGCGALVALGSERRVAFIPTALAVICTGATYTPYDIKVGRAVLGHKMGIAPPKYLICSKRFWETYEDILRGYGKTIKTVITLDDGPSSATTVKSLIADSVDVDAFEPAPVEGQSDTAFITYSSGTTGMPKAVQLTHLNCIINCLPYDFKDEYLKTAYCDAEWGYICSTFLTLKVLYNGGKMVFFSDNLLDGRLKYFAQSQVDVAYVVPTALKWMMNVDNSESQNLDSLKIIHCCAAPLHVKTIECFKRRFPNVREVVQIYGMSEFGDVTSETCGSKGYKPGSVGSPSPGITMKVVDPDTRELRGPHQRGEICVKGITLMKGYIGISRDTYLDEQGFYKTGDLGYYDDDGYFFIVDRLKEIFKYNDFTIAPQELETILQLHPAVLEAAVVGKRVPMLGDEPAAFVVLKPGAAVSEKELVDYVVTEVTPYMQLRGGVRFIPELPKSPRGKVLRRVLREMLNESK